MSRNIIGMYPDHGVAEAVVRDLLEAGLARERISVAIDEPTRRYRELATMGDRRRERNGAKGAITGLALGLVLGLLAALIGALAFAQPWTLGPDVISSFALLGAIGAAVGLVVGWLIGMASSRGIPIPAKHPRADLLRREGVVVAAEAPTRDFRRYARVMERHNPIDLDRRARSWHGHHGWRPLLPAVAATAALAGRDREPEPRREPRYEPERRAEPFPRDERAQERREPTWGAAERGREPEWRADEREHAREHERRGPTELPAPAHHAAALGPQPSQGHAPPARSGLREYGAEGTGETDWVSSSFASLEPRFRRHFDRNLRDRGESWDVHRSAYETGLRLAWDGRSKPFTGFHELENLARLRWENTEHGDTSFRRVRDSIAYAYEEGRLAFA